MMGGRVGMRHVIVSCENDKLSNPMDYIFLLSDLDPMGSFVA